MAFSVPQKSLNFKTAASSPPVASPSPSTAPGNSASWRATRGRGIPAQCGRRCPRAASAWRRCRGNDAGAIRPCSTPALSAISLQRSCMKRKLMWLFGDGKTRAHSGTLGCRRRMSATSFENGTVRSSQSFGRNAYCGFARTCTRRCARSRSAQCSVCNSPRRKPVESAREKKARSQSVHFSKNFLRSASGGATELGFGRLVRHLSGLDRSCFCQLFSRHSARRPEPL